MDTQKKLIIGVVALAVLGGLAYRQIKSDAQVGKATTTSADPLPELKVPDDVDKLSVTNGKKGEIVLEKKGDKWFLTKPVQADANQQAVKSMLDNMKELKLKEVVNAATTEEQKKDYEFDAEKVVRVMAWKGADKKLDASFGKSGGRGQLVMVDGKPSVFAGTGYSSYVYAREVKSWRDADVLKFDSANANQVTIVNKTGEFSFTKGDKWAGTFKAKPADPPKAIDKFDDSKVPELLRSFAALNADDFADGKTPAELGLDAPEATITISLKDNAGKYTVKFGKEEKDKKYYAKKDSSDVLYILGTAPSEWATVKLAKFQKSADAGAPPPAPMPPGMGMPPGMDPHGH